jgi:drug/metabolite transporter (DMT)-like permease
MSDDGRGAKRSTLPFVAFATCTLIWGSTFLVIRIGNDTVPPVWASALRLAIAAALLTGFAFALRQPWPRGARLRAALAFGIMDFGISLPLLYWGEREVPSAIAAILFATMPLMTSVLAHAMGLERMTPVKIVAGLVGLAGVGLLVSSEIGGHIPPLPLLAVFLSAATAAVAGVLLKRSPGGAPITTNAIAHAAGVPFCVAASLALRESQALPASSAEWMPILYLTLVGSVVAFVAFAWLVQRWSVVRISFVSVITPVIATALGASVRHERLGPAALAGGLVVLGAVTLAIVADTRAFAAAPKR